jgi:integrase
MMMRKVEKVIGRNPYKVRFRSPGGVQSSKRFRTHKEARTFAVILDEAGIQDALDYVRERDMRAGIPTLDEWAPVAFAQRSGLSDGTRADYQRVYDRTFGPRLGRMQLHTITKAGVSKALIDLSENAGLSDKSCSNAHGILSGLMKDAIDAGHILTTPCKGIRMPRRTSHESTEMRFLSHAEYAKLHECLPEHWRPFVAFLVGTGARFGEAGALLAEDVDLLNGTVRIRRAVKWNGNAPSARTIGPPKTKRSRRTIALPHELVPLLIPLVEGNRGEVFRATRGGPVQHSYFYPKVWKPAIRKAGLDGVRVHDLRHTHVSWLIASGVDIVTIQRRLGHESVTTTVDRYGHLAPDMDAGAAAAVARALLDVGVLREIDAA